MYTYTGVEDGMHLRMHAHRLALDIVAVVVGTMVVMTGGYDLPALDEYGA